jgi:hypothetical protein
MGWKMVDDMPEFDHCNEVANKSIALLVVFE